MHGIWRIWDVNYTGSGAGLGCDLPGDILLLLYALGSVNAYDCGHGMELIILAS